MTPNGLAVETEIERRIKLVRGAKQRLGRGLSIEELDVILEPIPCARERLRKGNGRSAYHRRTWRRRTHADSN